MIKKKTRNDSINYKCYQYKKGNPKIRNIFFVFWKISKLPNKSLIFSKNSDDIIKNPNNKLRVYKTTIEERDIISIIRISFSLISELKYLSNSGLKPILINYIM